MTDPIVELVALSVIKKRVVELISEAQERVQLNTGDRLTALLGGAKIGSVTKAHGATRAKVTDAAAFLEWVRENRPDEIREQPSDLLRSQVLAAAVKNGVAVTEDGELIPGITVVEGDDYMSTRPTDDALALVAAAYRSGAYRLPLTALEGE